MLPNIIVLISLLLDGILNNTLPYMKDNLSFFTPLITIISLLIVYPFYYKKNSKYYLTAIILGLIYDLLYTNMLFLNSILFLAIALLIKIIYKNIELNYLNIILYIILTIITYEISQYILIIIFNLTSITINQLFYKISHSLLLNIIYGELLYLIINYIPSKYKKININ